MTSFSSVVPLRASVRVRREAGGVWWPFGAFWDWIGYGPRSGDQHLLSVIDAIADTIKVHLESAGAILPGDLQPQLLALGQMFNRAMEADVPDLATLLAIDFRLNALYPQKLAAKRYWMIRDRFERVAAANAYKEWWLFGQNGKPSAFQGNGANKPDGALPEAPATPADDGNPANPARPPTATSGTDSTSPPSPLPPKCEEADSNGRYSIPVMLSYIHTNYIMGIARQRAERDIKQWLLGRAWLCIMLLIGGGLAADWILPRYGFTLTQIGAGTVIAAMAGLGRAGALISISQRLQNAVPDNAMAQDSVQELVALRTGRAGLRVALLSGSVFALLIWGVFASGAAGLLGASQGLFPTSSQSEAGKLDKQSRDADEQERDRLIALNGQISQLVELAPRATAPTSTPAPASALDPTRLQIQTLLKAEKDERERARASSRSPEQPDCRKVQQGLHGDPVCVARWLGLARTGDLLLLLLWCFLAGFAERLVPDALDRLAGATQQRNSATPN